MEMHDILQSVLTVAVGFICALLLLSLRTLIARIDRAEQRAQEDRAAAERRAAEGRAAADKRAAEDRAANKADHDRLFDAVSGLQSEVGDLKAVVNVLKDRSDRAERDSAAG